MTQGLGFREGTYIKLREYKRLKVQGLGYGDWAAVKEFVFSYNKMDTWV